jgi:hypothetical protein
MQKQQHKTAFSSRCERTRQDWDTKDTSNCPTQQRIHGLLNCSFLKNIANPMHTTIWETRPSQKDTDARPPGPRAKLGHRLRFVDIKKKQLHTVDLTAGPSSLHTLQLDMPVGVTADIEGLDPREKILVGGKSGIYVLDRKTGKHQLLQRFYDTKDQDERLRSNDGAADPQGRFWIGTMNDFWVGSPKPEGELPCPISHLSALSSDI